MKVILRKLLSAFFIFSVAGVVFCCSYKENNTNKVLNGDGQPVIETEEISSGFSNEETSEAPLLWVYICGSVKMPGVYSLNEGSRLFEAVEAAGGFLENAASESINMASLLFDGQMIFVPDIDSAEDTVYKDASKNDGLIDINSASREDLMTLPGIGSSKADAIIAYRSEAPFSSIEDIMNVSGIKQSSFDKIKGLIKTGR